MARVRAPHIEGPEALPLRSATHFGELMNVPHPSFFEGAGLAIGFCASVWVK